MENWFSEILALSETDSEVQKFPERLFNMDETCFFLASKGGLIIGPRGQHVYNESANSDKENITTLFAVNSKGQFAPPLSLYERANPSITGCSSTKQLGYWQNGKWMDDLRELSRIHR
ncbi:hypothetical protein JTB14_004884 [Gonioctena quinquepunctata]|nr:hypothetical protein JTB14_004884 [Gonioctena quinquepunctata]